MRDAGFAIHDTGYGMQESSPGAARSRLLELALLFGRLGSTVFGGPAVHIAVMEEEVVRRRGWLTGEEFLDLVGAANLIPGPNSTELAIHIGHRRAGWAGLVVAGACFILPATLLAIGAGWLYGRYGRLPDAEGLLRGVRPVIVAVVLQALWGFARTACRTRMLTGLALVSAGASFAGGHELAVLFGTGAAAVMMAGDFRGGRGAAGGNGGTGRRWAALGPAGWVAVAGGAGTVPFGLGTLFGTFLKTGSVLFGSGYVLLAFLRADLVDRYGWLTEAQLLDAVVVGQATPGPVFSTATFIGYLLGGVPGALVATAGIFLPAFVFVALSGPLIPRLRASPVTGAFLDGVNVASLALMASVTVQMGYGSLRDPFSLALAGISAGVLIRYRPNPTWLILGGAVLGLLSGWWR